MTLLAFPLIGMIFSTPAAAAAVLGAAAAIPVLIHLLNRKRHVVVPWAAMRFLLAAQRKNVRRLRLEQWILLAVRALIGILIVVAMCAIMPWAEPIWQRIVTAPLVRATNQGRTHHIIVIDGSYSMAGRADGDGSRFDLAKMRALELLEQSAPGDGFSLIVLGSTAQTIVPGPADDRRGIEDEIKELAQPWGNSDVAGGLRLVTEMAQKPLGKYQRREVVFITDLKRSGWPLAPPARKEADTETGSGPPPALAELGRAADLVFIDVAQRDVENVSVSSLILGDTIAFVNTATTVNAVIQNHGKRTVENLPVELKVGKAPPPADKLELQPVGQKFVTIKPGETVTATFKLDEQNRFREPGDYVLQVTAGTDDLPIDNIRRLAVTARESISVLVVDGSAATQSLGTPGEWIVEALRPGGKKTSPVFPVLVTPEQFADRFRTDLTKFDCVILCDPPPLEKQEIDRFDAHLRRGASIILSLGPNAAANLNVLNQSLFKEGKGILPGKLLGVRRAEGAAYYTLLADAESFKQPPLSAYRDDRERAALTVPHFHQYMRLDSPTTGPARRLFSFLPMNDTDPAVAKPIATLDPAVVDFPKHRGRVIIHTSTFNPEKIGANQFWSTWPPHPTFLPFLHESLRYAVAGSHRKNLFTGDGIETDLPIALVGLKARLLRGAGDTEAKIEDAPIVSRDETAVVSFARADQSGIYRIAVPEQDGLLFAVNLPVTAAGGGSESDLRRWSPAEVEAAGPEASVQVVPDASLIQQRSRTSALTQVERLQPEPQGTYVARFILIAAFLLMLLEVWLAWQLGSARASLLNTRQSPPTSRPILVFASWFVPTLVGTLLIGTWAHALVTDDFLGFLPSSWRQAFEQSLHVPQSSPGEETRWRLKTLPWITGSWNVDGWLTGVLAALVLGYVGFIYSRERLDYAVASRRRFLNDPRLPPGILRGVLLLITLFILLPRVQLIFEREAWPDVVIIFDDSKSMASVETFHNPLLREKSDELKKVWKALAQPRIDQHLSKIEELRKTLDTASIADAAKFREEIARLEKRIEDLRTPHRLNLVKALLASGSQDWLRSFLDDRKMRVHLFRASVQASKIVDLSEPEQCERLLDEIIDIFPDGESSRLGDTLENVLKAFRGRSLNAVIMFTDGQTTKGEEPSKAAAEALKNRKKVPLFFVGVGDNEPRPDIAVRDLKAEREINLKDRLVFEFRVASEGPGLPESVPVRLLEIVDGQPVARQTLTVPLSDRPIRLTHLPETPGEKVYVIDVPPQNGETDTRNNRIEHEVYVAELRRVRVLLIEEWPRYEYRYVKSLLERESDLTRGNKAIDLSVFLVGAGPDFAKQDRSALAEFPSGEALRSYDVIILGDVDPKKLPNDPPATAAMAEFVKARGGGLLVVAGPRFTPHAYANSELAEVLPVSSDGIAPPAPPKESDPPIRETYQPKRTTMGVRHPIFRFVTDEADNTAIWDRLMPMYWYSTGYRAKPAAEALAVHPQRLAEAGPGGGSVGNHPLVLQQFSGAGRVLFFGFEETWRWRHRLDEPRFNQFWVQAIRSLARARVGRIEIHTAEKIYRRDDPIRVTVHFPDDAPAPPPETRVAVRVERRPLPVSGKTPSTQPEVETVLLRHQEKSRGTFETILTQKPEGEYRFVLVEPKVAGREPTTEVTVLPPKGELEEIRLKESDLRKAAAETAGDYFTLDQGLNAFDKVPDGPRQKLDQPCPPLPFWNHPLMFALVMAMLIAEWMLRKRARLL